MAQAAPQTIYADLRGLANRLLSSGNVNEFEIRRLAADIEKLTPLDPLGALEIKATLAAIRGEHQASTDLFDRLLQVTNVEARFLLRAIQVAAISGQSFRLKSLYDEHLLGHQLPVAWKREMWQLLGFNGWFRESGRLQNELRESGEDPGAKDANLLAFPEELIEDLKEAQFPAFVSRTSTTEVLDANQLGDEVVAALFAKSISLLRSWHLPPSGARTVNLVHDDSTSGILVSFMVQGECELVADAEWNLFGELANNAPQALLDGVISVGVLACQGEVGVN